MGNNPRLGGGRAPTLVRRQRFCNGVAAVDLYPEPISRSRDHLDYLG